jgi:hypothetical protein
MDTPSYPSKSPRKSGNRLFFGLILIIIGSIFLLEQVGNFSLKNWWALFILIPSFGSFSTAWYAFQRNQRLNEGVRAGVGGGLITLTVALIFLFNLDWTTWWPVMIAIPGVVIFLNGFTLPDSREAPRPLSMRLYRPWSGWIGLACIFLGTGFLAQNLKLFLIANWIPNWWAFAILIPAFGGLITALRLAASGNGLGWAGISNVATTLVFAVVGGIALLGIGWNLLTPIILIAIGLVLMVGIFRR